jgi:hypothetical protein
MVSVDFVCEKCGLSKDERYAVVPCGHAKTCIDCLDKNKKCGSCGAEYYYQFKVCL